MPPLGYQFRTHFRQHLQRLVDDTQGLVKPELVQAIEEKGKVRPLSNSEWVAYVQHAEKVRGQIARCWYAVANPLGRIVYQGCLPYRFTAALEPAHRVGGTGATQAEAIDVALRQLEKEPAGIWTGPKN